MHENSDQYSVFPHVFSKAMYLTARSGHRALSKPTRVMRPPAQNPPISSLPHVEDVDLELRLARFELLITRRPLLLNSVLLRQNPHNVHEWHKRVKLYEGKPHQVSGPCLECTQGGHSVIVRYGDMHIGTVK